MEAELGLVLIDRSQKKVNLTPEGQAFLLHAQKIMSAASAAKKDMARYHAGSRGKVQFGLPPMVEAYLFPDLFTQFQTSFPEISLDVQEYSDSDEVRNRLALGDLDFGIVLGEVRPTTENEMLLMQDSITRWLRRKKLPLPILPMKSSSCSSRILTSTGKLPAAAAKQVLCRILPFARRK